MSAGGRAARSRPRQAAPLPAVDAPCARHPDDPAVVRCASCGVALCGACWRREVDGGPWCEPCVRLVSAQGQGAAPAVAVGLAALLTGAVVWRSWRHELAPSAFLFWVTWLAGTAVAVTWAGAAERRDWTARIARRRTLPGDEGPEGARDERTDPAPPGAFPGRPGGHPYRVVWQRATRVLATPASGFWTSVVVLGCLAVAALAVPRALALPGWVEAELVLLSGWGVLLVALAALLHRGWRLADDHVLSPVSMPSGVVSSTVADAGLTGAGCLFEGAIGFGGFMLVAGGGLLALWIMVELALPFLFLLAYLIVRGALARVVNDHHGCQGRWPRALAWGALWATVYTAPFAAAVALLR